MILPACTAGEANCFSAVPVVQLLQQAMIAGHDTAHTDDTTLVTDACVVLRGAFHKGLLIDVQLQRTLSPVQHHNPARDVWEARQTNRLSILFYEHANIRVERTQVLRSSVRKPGNRRSQPGRHHRLTSTYSTACR